MRQAVRCAMLAGAIVVGAAGSSWGEDAATAQHDALARFNEGLARVQSGNFEGARMSFTQAYAVLHKPDILWNLALAEEKCGMALAALEHFKDYARQVPGATDRAGASKHIQDLAAKTGRIEIVAPTGATVSVDGATVGEAPLGDPVDVDPGRHHVVARSGRVAKSADSEVAPGQVVHVSFVTIDAEGPAVPAGPSVVAAPVPPETGGEPRRGDGTVGGPPSTMRAAGSFWTPRVVVAGSLGVAAVAAGVSGLVLGMRADSNFNSAQRLRGSNPDSSCSGSSSPGCAQLLDKVSAQHQDAIGSEILWTAGGVLLAGAVVTWFAWPNGSSNTASGVGYRVMPSVGMDGAGAVVSGTF